MKRTEDALRRLNTQLDPIIQLLKQTDSILLPRFNPATWLAEHAAFEMLSQRSSLEDLGRSTSPTTDSGTSSVQQKDEGPVELNVSVEIESSSQAQSSQYNFHIFSVDSLL